MDHEYFMRRAIELALKVPQFPFGAIIVKRDTGEIIAEGFNQSTLNPTFHGEVRVGLMFEVKSYEKFTSD